jgi:hypothetical protein
MRHLILPAVFLLTLSACSTYQYLTLDSPQLQKNDKNQLIQENDTLRITYSFQGKGGPFSVNIYNKTDQPLFVNWKKSALIRNEQSISLYNNNVIISAKSISQSYRYGNYTASAGSFAGSFALPEGMDFIPPASSISKGFPKLERTGMLSTDLPDSVRDRQMIGTDGINKVAYKQLQFREDQSPVKFKSYITFSIGNNNPQEFAETSSFYVGEVCQTHAEPETFPLYRQQGDQLYVKVSLNIPGPPSAPGR